MTHIHDTIRNMHDFILARLTDEFGAERAESITFNVRFDDADDSEPFLIEVGSDYEQTEQYFGSTALSAMGRFLAFGVADVRRRLEQETRQ